MCCYRRSRKHVLCPPCDYLINPEEYSVLRLGSYKSNVSWFDNFFAIYEKYGRTYTYEEIINKSYK